MSATCLLACFAVVASFLLASETAASKLANRPPGFGIVFETENGERVDTFKGIVTKDLVMRRDTTITLRLTAAELDTLYDAVIQLGIFAIREPHPAQDPFTTMSPHEGMRLRVGTRARSLSLSWSTERGPHPNAAAEWGRLYEFIALLRRLVTNHPEFRALPRPAGGYL